jgi:hypothetical protein
MIACLYQRQIFILTPVKHTSLLRQIVNHNPRKFYKTGNCRTFFGSLRKNVFFNYMVKKRKKDIVVRASLSVENAPA